MFDQNKIDKLRQFVKLQNDEHSETIEFLLMACNNLSYMSSELASAIVKELEFELKWYEANYEIIEKEVTVVKKYSELQEKEDKTDIHTEHCCAEHGCKYNDENCTVVNRILEQTFLCEECK